MIACCFSCQLPKTQPQAAPEYCNYLPVLFLGALPGKPASASRMSDVAPWPLEKVEECDDPLFPMLQLCFVK